MQRSRTAARISESLHHRLNSYALAASAAGVGALALAVSAEAKIIYTPAHKVIGKGQTFKLDLNHDGMVDFGLYIYTCTTLVCTTYRKEFFIYGHDNATYNVIGITGSTADGAGIAAALRKGSKIPGKSSVFEDAVLAGKSSSRYLGNWLPNVKNRYLGLTFYVNGKKHYGWARVSVRTRQHPFTVTGVLSGYAYETIPNKPIIAGKTKGPDVITLQDASLGHLARGAEAIPAWRGKESR